MIRDLEDRVILDVMDDVFSPQGRYPEHFVLISSLEVCQEWVVKKGGTWRSLWVQIGGMEDRVILDLKNDVFYPNEDTPNVLC